MNSNKLQSCHKVGQLRYYGYDSTLQKLAIVVVIGIVAAFALFFGVIMPPGQIAQRLNQVQAAPINTKETAISAGTILYAYSSNASLAIREYNGRSIYLKLDVKRVPQASNNLYESCLGYDAQALLSDDCTQVVPYGGWIIWEWSLTTAISSIPISSDIIAECNIEGMSAGNLVLDSCEIIS